jgi:hypothetical protein
VADQHPGLEATFRECLNRRHNVIGVTQHPGFTELPITIAQPGEIKPQYGKAALSKLTRDTHGRNRIAATGKAMCEYRDRTRRPLDWEFKDA